MARRVLHDHYFKLAKAEGYLARSAYKLSQIQDARRIIRPGDAVLDLGCAPGAWLQVASKLVGNRGSVVGIDLQHVDARFAPNVRVLRGDVCDTSPDDLLPDPPRPFDCVLSDMAPRTTGHNEHELSVRLCRRVLELLPDLLRPGGNLAMKVFEGAEYPALLSDTADVFNTARGCKPKASRAQSREMYIVATGFTTR